ncbi:hypothetical protein Thiowin_00537 [Thiorhodovibrio winogradskyi]|uniref:PilZ domain-containing protein n=1 Tax=Thiorhodovibrio winogradskyi TaxID=77007 RepID=A0ABZ0S5U2_9GAMM|nr:hypothetical protein [Thiorhodovibrio winogradskyi]
MNIGDDEDKASRRLKVGVRISGSDQPIIQKVLDVGLASGIMMMDTCIGCGQTVQLTFDEAPGEVICVDCVVEPHGVGRYRLRYCAPKEQIRERLRRIIWPDWDGANLLDGALLMAERYEVASLSDLLRLTSLLSVMQPSVNLRRHAIA